MANSRAPAHPIGSLVYGFGNPRKVGVVRALRPYQLPRATVTGVEVEWPDGSRDFAPSHYFSALDDLIADHARKLEGHMARRAETASRYGVNLPPVAKP